MNPPSPDPTCVRVLLADDHPVVRDGYRRLLDSTPDLRVVAEAGDGDGAYGAYQTHRPDVVVLDLSMPGGGLDAIRRIRARDPAARILVFSMHDSDTMIRRACDAGALGYLVKHSGAEQLITAVRQVAQGRSYRHPTPASASGERQGTGDPARDLTAREFQIFQLIAEGQSLAEIATVLHISQKTVNVHHANIMAKLQLRSDAQLVRMAFLHGIVRP